VGPDYGRSVAGSDGRTLPLSGTRLAGEVAGGRIEGTALPSPKPSFVPRVGGTGLIAAKENQEPLIKPEGHWFSDTGPGQFRFAVKAVNAAQLKRSPLARYK